MPSELFDSDGDHMTDVGHEFGTTTGRRRRCGWLDLVVLRHANRVNGFTSMAMTKLDVLGGIDPLKICVGYRLDGKEIHEMPASSAALARCEPILIEMPGFPPEPLEVWLDLAKKADVEGLGYSALPSAAQAYIRHVENLLGVPITSVGIGPDRDATIERAD
jgi:adenylosuccinate synthase